MIIFYEFTRFLAAIIAGCIFLTSSSSFASHQLYEKYPLLVRAMEYKYSINLNDTKNKEFLGLIELLKNNKKLLENFTDNALLKSREDLVDIILDMKLLGFDKDELLARLCSFNFSSSTTMLEYLVLYCEAKLPPHHYFNLLKNKRNWKHLEYIYSFGGLSLISGVPESAKSKKTIFPLFHLEGEALTFARTLLWSKNIGFGLFYRETIGDEIDDKRIFELKGLNEKILIVRQIFAGYLNAINEGDSKKLRLLLLSEKDKKSQIKLATGLLYYAAMVGDLNIARILISDFGAEISHDSDENVLVWHIFGGFNGDLSVALWLIIKGAKVEGLWYALGQTKDLSIKQYMIDLVNLLLKYGAKTLCDEKIFSIVLLKHGLDKDVNWLQLLENN